MRNVGWWFPGGVALCLFAALPGIAAEQVYVVNGKKPSVVIVDAEQWKPLASIPIDAEPGWAQTGPNGRFLYIVHRGPASATHFWPEDRPSTLTVVDAEKHEAVKSIPLPWRVVMVAFSQDSRYLIVSSRGRMRVGSPFGLTPGKKSFLPEGGQTAAGEPGGTGYLTLVDTQTNTVAISTAIGRYPRQVLWTKDVSRVFVLAAGSLAKGKSWPKDPDSLLAAWGLMGDDQKLYVLSPENPSPVAEIPVDARASSMLLSKDEKWLYVLQSGTPPEDILQRTSLSGKYQLTTLDPAIKKKEHFPGRLLVVDAAAAKKAADYEVGTAPRGLHLDSQTGAVLLLSQAGPEDYSGKLYRLSGSQMLPPLDVGRDPQFPVRCPGEAGVRIVSTEDVRLLGDAGQWSGDPLLLNRILKKGEPAGKPTQLYLGDSPTMPICLPKANTLAVLTKTARVGLLDLNQNKLVQFFFVGPAGGGLGALLGGFALGLSGAPLEGGGAIPVPPGRLMDLMNAEQMGAISPDRDSGPWQVVPRPDGAFLYLFDGQSGKAGIADVKQGTIVGTLRFGMGCNGIRRPPGGKFVFGVHSGSVTLIDTATNQQSLKHRVPNETIRDAVTRKQGTQLLVLTDTTLQAVEPQTGKVLGTVAGLSAPRFVVEPGRVLP
jgi:DNA-binding beta-propeller fold protein YncE